MKPNLLDSFTNQYCPDCEMFLQSYVSQHGFPRLSIAYEKIKLKETENEHYKNLDDIVYECLRCKEKFVFQNGKYIHFYPPLPFL